MNSDRLAASQAWRSYRWSVVRNPLYWLTWLPTMLLIVAGRQFHRLLGQHGPLHTDGESDDEHEVRVWWVYPSDAGFVAGLVVVVADAIVDTVEGTFHGLSLLISFVIYAVYVASNVFFLHAVAARSVLHVRAFILGNVFLAVAISALLAELLVRIVSGQVPAKQLGSSTQLLVFTWVLRVGLVLFFPLAAATYARLWPEYDTVPQHDAPPQHDAQAHMASVVRPPAAHQPGGDYVLEETVVDSAARAEPPQPSPQRGRAVRWHYASLLAAFATGAIVSGLLIAAELLDNEALWSALAYCTV